MKYLVIVLLLILSSILAPHIIQLYNINRANAIDQNPDQQIITIESPVVATTALSPKTSINNNNDITTNTTGVLAAAATASIPSAESVLPPNQSPYLPR